MHHAVMTHAACIAWYCSGTQDVLHGVTVTQDVLHGVTVMQDVLHGVAMTYDLLHGVAVTYDLLHGVTVTCDLLHGVTVMQDVLHGVAVTYDLLHGVTLTQGCIAPLSTNQMHALLDRTCLCVHEATCLGTKVAAWHTMCLCLLRVLSVCKTSKHGSAAATL